MNPHIFVYQKCTAISGSNVNKIFGRRTEQQWLIVFWFILETKEIFCSWIKYINWYNFMLMNPSIGEYFFIEFKNWVFTFREGNIDILEDELSNMVSKFSFSFAKILSSQRNSFKVFDLSFKILFFSKLQFSWGEMERFRF